MDFTVDIRKQVRPGDRDGMSTAMLAECKSQLDAFQVSEPGQLLVGALEDELALIHEELEILVCSSNDEDVLKAAALSGQASVIRMLIGPTWGLHEPIQSIVNAATARN